MNLQKEFDRLLEFANEDGAVDDSPPEKIEDLRRAFYAGALAAFGVMRRGSAAQVLFAHSELMAFTSEMKREADAERRVN